LSDAGADVVDLNLGCPTRQAAKKRVGAALLSDADLISRIVTAMRAACHCRLSVKIRIVDSSPDEVLHIAKAVEAAGADFLIVHPRTRHQAYTGVADWSVVKRLKSHLSIPVVGNGDLWYASDALRLMRLSGADAIMLGRPVLRNPFLFRQIEELRNGQPLFVPKGNDIVEYIARLADIFETGKKQARPNNPLKAHVQRVLGAVPEPQRSRVRERALRVTGLAEIFEAIKPLRDVELLDLAADGPFRFETAPSDPV
jgi:tRNA-dihydrouridine synthase